MSSRIKFPMGHKYTECQKTHAHLRGKTDGCQEYLARGRRLDCEVCGCHRNFHRKVAKAEPRAKCETEVMYTKCDQNHAFAFDVSVDGCQEFIPSGGEGSEAATTCAACGCHRNFHRKMMCPAEVVYTKCHKIHRFINKSISVDGCQKFIAGGKEGTEAALKCAHCGCHKGFHRKVEVVYSKCLKTHEFGIEVSVDGCQEFWPSGEDGTAAALICAACGCHRSFHRNDIRTQEEGEQLFHGSC